MKDVNTLQWKVLRNPKDRFLSYSAREMAEQIAATDAELFLACRREELASSAWQGAQRGATAPNVVRYITHMTNMQRWIAGMILSQEALDPRIQSLEKVIAIAKVSCSPLLGLISGD
jgi:hypothetical protein